MCHRGSLDGILSHRHIDRTLIMKVRVSIVSRASLATDSLVVHATSPEVFAKRRPTRTQEHQLRCSVLSELLCCEDNNTKSVNILIPCLSNGSNYPISQSFFVCLQAVFAHFEYFSGETVLEHVNLVFQHDSTLKEILEDHEEFASSLVVSPDSATSLRHQLEKHRKLPKRQIGCVKVSQTCFVGSLVEKWADKNEGKRLRHGADYIRQIVNENHAKISADHALKAKAAESKRDARMSRQKSSKCDKVAYMQEKRKNFEYKSRENESRMQRRASNIDEERESQKLQKQQVRTDDVLEELKKKSAERRANPIKNRMYNMLRRIRRKIQQVCHSSSAVSSLPTARQALYKQRAQEIRSRNSRIMAQEVRRQALQKKNLNFERKAVTDSGRVSKKYRRFSGFSMLVPKRMANLISSCQNTSGADFPDFQESLLKRKRLLVNMLASSSKFAPSVSEVNQGKVEVDGLYFAGLAVAKEVEKKVESIKSILVKCSKRKSTRAGLTEEQNEVLAIAGGHAHVRSHEGNLIKDKSHYQKVKPFYSNFGAEMRERGQVSPTHISSAAAPSPSSAEVHLNIGEVMKNPPLAAPEVALISLKEFEESDSDESDKGAPVNPSAPPLEEGAGKMETIPEDVQPWNTDEEDDLMEDPETWMRPEDDECQAMLPERNWAREIREALAELEGIPSETLLRHLVAMEICRKCCRSLCTPKTCSNFLKLLRLLEPHFPGIRSILRRWYELKEYLIWMRKWNHLEASDRSTYIEYKNLVSTEAIPREVAKKIVLKRTSEVDFSLHTEPAVMLNYGTQIKKFRDAIQDTERFDCASCNRMMKGSKVKRVSVDDPCLPGFILPPREETKKAEKAVAESAECDSSADGETTSNPQEPVTTADEEANAGEETDASEQTNAGEDTSADEETNAGEKTCADDDTATAREPESEGEEDNNGDEKKPKKAKELIICTDCLKELKHGRMPPLCVQNGLFVDELPDELKNLHWLEYAVIRRIRPLISKFQLENAQGTKKGTFGGYKSTVMHFPVPIDNTMKKTLNDMSKLPSMENVDIAVLVLNKNGRELKYSFNIKRVIKALQWLKKHNPHYADIEIDEEAASIREVFKKYNFEMDNCDVQPDGENEQNQQGEGAAEREQAEENQEDQQNEESQKKQYMFTQLPEPSHITHTNVDMDPPKNKASDLYFKLKDHKGDPLKTNTVKHLEAKAFPGQFPLGRGDFDTDREVPLSKTVYIHNRVRNADPRFREPDYACHWNNERDTNTMLSAVNFSAKKTMNVGTLHSMAKDQLDEDVYPTFSALKGSDGFWKERRMDLNAAVEMLGPATFFFTLNPAEGEWEELRSLYEERYPHYATKSTSEFCAMDPLIFTRHFHHRVEAAYKHLIGPNGVLGPVKDYFRRIEYQRRGAPHCHGLLWVEGAPIIGESSEEELVRYIDKYITTRMPDAILEPNLYQMVNKHQIHRCTKTCLTQYKKGKTKLKKCRFGHPFDIQLQTVMEKRGEDDDPKARKKNYTIRRLYNGLRINPYNPAVLLAWNGNMDIQFVSEVSLNTVRYVTGYLAKGETKAIAMDALAGAEHLTKKDLIKMAMLLLRQREMGLPEVFARLTGQHLYDASFSVKFLNTNEKEKRIRMMKSKTQIENLAADEKITQNNIIDDYYPHRPKDMEARCLYNVFAALEFSKKKPEKGKRDPEKKQAPAETNKDDFDEYDGNVLVDALADLQMANNVASDSDAPTPMQLFPQGSVFKIGKNFGYFKAKTKLKIVRFFMNDLNGKEEDTEDYCRRCLLLFKPWRDEEKDLKGDFETFHEAFEDFMRNCSDKTRGEIMKLLHAKQNMIDALNENKRRAEIRKKLMEKEDDEDGEAIVMPSWDVTEEKLEKGVEMLNEKQKEAYLGIIDALENESSKKNYFISGVAGTGKSHLIKTLADYIFLKHGVPGKENTSPPVLLSAPTGKAALNIKGMTIHSLLGLNVEKGRTASYSSLRPKKLHDLQILFKNCKVMIVDEVSMVSNIMLMMIHRRLQEITGRTSELFGGIMVVAFGDLFQLPPVRLPPVYQPIRKELLNQIFKSVHINFNLWENAFEYFELTENMRQREELEYAEMLNRFRTACPEQKDFEALFERYISTILGKRDGTNLPQGTPLEEAGKYFLKLLEEDPKAIAIFGYTKAVNAFNNYILECRRDNLDLPIIEIPAIQGPMMRKNEKGKMKRPYLQKDNRHEAFLTDKKPRKHSVDVSPELDDDAKRCGGLVKVLRVQEGARVMLTRNVPNRMREGLVNGAMGILKSIDIADGEVQQLHIQFDKIDGLIRIDRDSAVYDVGEHMTTYRRQFSIMVSYAQTVHKSQGDTVKNVLADLYSLFDEGQMYVLLSRPTSIRGLHIIDFHPQALKCSQSAVMEYNRLRKMIGMDVITEANMKPPITATFSKYSKDWATQFVNREDFTNATEDTLFITADKDYVPLIKGIVQKPKKERPVKRNWSKTIFKKNQHRPIKRRTVEADISYNAPTIRLKKENSKLKISIDTSGKKAQAENDEAVAEMVRKDALLLSNSSELNYCFANSVVQIIRRCWRAEVTRVRGGGPPSEPLKKLQSLVGSYGVRSVQQLLHVANSNGFFNDKSQHSAAEYFIYLIGVCRAPHLTQTMEFLYIDRVFCPCGYMHDTDQYLPVLQVASERRNGSLSDYLTDVEEPDSIPGSSCRICQGTLQRRNVIEISASSSHFILEFAVSDRRGAVKMFRSITLPTFPFRFKGMLWNLVATVEHHGPNLQAGHYVAWTEKNGRWLCHNDSSETEHQSIPTTLKSAAMMVFEKC